MLSENFGVKNDQTIGVGAKKRKNEFSLLVPGTQAERSLPLRHEFPVAHTLRQQLGVRVVTLSVERLAVQGLIR